MSRYRQLIPHTILKRQLSVGASGAAVRNKAIERFGAPASIHAIPDDASDAEHYTAKHHRHAGARVGAIGCSRRVFLFDPHLQPAEIEGLAYRIHALRYARRQTFAFTDSFTILLMSDKLLVAESVPS